MNYMQLDIFNILKDSYKIKKPIRLIELFAGIGAQAKSLERLGVPFEHYKVVEFDKYAIASYNAIHNTNFPAMDVTKISGKDLGIVDKDKYEYILTYSFPCTDLSLAGRMAGMEKGSGTRSSLLWEVERLINELGTELPQVLLMENVPQIISKKNMDSFQTWIDFLESKGYSNFYQLLNAKDYNIPQNRVRCFMVSILGNYTYTFPQPIPLTKHLKDLLEPEVDEKYYLSRKMLDFVKVNEIKESNEIEQVGSLKGAGLPWDKMNESTCRIYSEEGCSPTLDSMQGGHRQPKILIKNTANRDVVVLGGIGEKKSNNGTQWYQQDRIYDDKVALSVTTTALPYYATVEQQKETSGLCIRKLTPKECWRLMDFDDEDFNKAKKNNSNTQLYKQAGNSIVVAILEAIFKQLL